MQPGAILGWSRTDRSIVGWLLQTKALIMIIFANVLLDKGVITADTFTALLLMAVASTILTTPIVSRLLLRRAREPASDAATRQTAFAQPDTSTTGNVA